MAGSVIQATGTVEFENGLRTGVLPGGCWYTVVKYFQEEIKMDVKFVDFSLKCILTSKI